MKKEKIQDIFTALKGCQNELLKNNLDAIYTKFKKGYSFTPGELSSFLINEVKIDVLNYVTTVYPGMFDGVVFEGTVTIKDGVNVEPGAFTGAYVPQLIISGKSNLQKEAFKGVDGLEYVVFGKDSKMVPEHCFQGCNELKKVWLPISVKYIYRGAFDGCNMVDIISPLRYNDNDQIRFVQSDRAFLRAHLFDDYDKDEYMNIMKLKSINPDDNQNDDKPSDDATQDAVNDDINDNDGEDFDDSVLDDMEDM